MQKHNRNTSLSSHSVQVLECGKNGDWIPAYHAEDFQQKEIVWSIEIWVYIIYANTKYKELYQKHAKRYETLGRNSET